MLNIKIRSKVRCQRRFSGVLAQNSGKSFANKVFAVFSYFIYTVTTFPLEFNKNLSKRYGTSVSGASGRNTSDQLCPVSDKSHESQSVAEYEIHWSNRYEFWIICFT